MDEMSEILTSYVYSEPNILSYFLQNKFNSRKEHVLEEMKKEIMHSKKDDEDEDWGDGKCVRHKKFLWDLMEKPHTSLAAKVYYVCIVYCIVPKYVMQGPATLLFLWDH